jgi:hypothetical protein
LFPHFANDKRTLDSLFGAFSIIKEAFRSPEQVISALSVIVAANQPLLR